MSMGGRGGSSGGGGGGGGTRREEAAGGGGGSLTEQMRVAAALPRNGERNSRALNETTSEASRFAPRLRSKNSYQSGQDHARFRQRITDARSAQSEYHAAVRSGSLTQAQVTALSQARSRLNSDMKRYRRKYKL